MLGFPNPLITLRVAARFCETLKDEQSLQLIFQNSHILFLVNTGVLGYNRCTKKKGGLPWQKEEN
jgi:hypothetical protein